MQDLVRPYADPTLGPVLHVGCGDAPVPEHLHAAGGGTRTGAAQSGGQEVGMKRYESRWQEGSEVGEMRWQLLQWCFDHVQCDRCFC